VGDVIPNQVLQIRLFVHRQVITKPQNFLRSPDGDASNDALGFVVAVSQSSEIEGEDICDLVDVYRVRRSSE
jgi:hypothetical protein